MASRPYFDGSHKAWRMKWWSGPSTKWRQVTLGPHPGWQPGQKAPSRVPAAIEMIARKYRDLELQAKHGVPVGHALNTPLAGYLADYQAKRKATLSPNTLRMLAGIVRTFLDYCTVRDIHTLGAVTVAVCRDYLAERSRKVGYNSLRLDRVMLFRVWKLAADEELVSVNPWAKAPVPGRPKSDPPPYWTVEEIAVLMKSINQQWLRDVVTVGLNSGLRITALLNLEWRDLDFNQGMIRVREEITKGHAYQVPMSPDCLAVLKRRHAKRDPKVPLVFTSPKLGVRMNATRTYVRIRDLVRRIEIPDHGSYNHILRHTFATHAVMRGVPLPIVQSWLGHKSIAMTMRYAHVMPSESHRQMQSFGLGLASQTDNSSANPRS